MWLTGRQDALAQRLGRAALAARRAVERTRHRHLQHAPLRCHPGGTRLARIRGPDKVHHLCFGGPAGDGLIIAASRSIQPIRLGSTGPVPQ